MNNGWEKKLSRSVGRSAMSLFFAVAMSLFFAAAMSRRPVGESQNKANSDPSAELQLGRVWAWQKLMILVSIMSENLRSKNLTSRIILIAS